MGDVPAIVAITALYAGITGAIGVVVAWTLRNRSLRVTTIMIALVPVAVFVAALVGTARAMFLSAHDLKVATVASVAACLIALAFGGVVGETLARRSRMLQEHARRFAVDGSFARPLDGGPAELTALAHELEATSQKLAAARDRERRLEGSRRELVAWVSHDLRTPLAGIRAMAEALEDGMADDADRYHRQIRSEVERMGRMVDDLFELSRIQAGAFDLVPSEVALGDLVSDVIAGADPIARERGVRLGGSVTGDAVVLVDPARMSRVLLNLVSNAIRHTPADGAVQIIGHADEAGVELSVDDACGGIPDDELSRVFDVAWRGESARSPDAVGTGAGLGLAIVRGIVEAHRGSVDVQNHGSGCRFLVRIPAGSAHA